MQLEVEIEFKIYNNSDSFTVSTFNYLQPNEKIKVESNQIDSFKTTYDF